MWVWIWWIICKLLWGLSPWWRGMHEDIDGLVPDCSNSSALAMELLQSCTKPSIWFSISIKSARWCFSGASFIMDLLSTILPTKLDGSHFGMMMSDAWKTYGHASTFSHQLSAFGWEVSRYFWKKMCNRSAYMGSQAVSWGHCFNIKTAFTGVGIPVIKTRIEILLRWHLNIEIGSRHEIFFVTFLRFLSWFVGHLIPQVLDNNILI